MKPIYRVAASLLATVGVAAAALPAHAQTYPTRQVAITVPYPPGGLIDLVARLIQQRMQAELGVPVVIENRTGAGGNVGAEYVARAAPDGYNLLLGNPSLGISPSLYKKMNYDTLKDLSYIGRYGQVSNVLVVSPTLNVKTAKELIEHLKSRPGKYNYGSPGYGTSPQMSMELFKAMTNTFVVHIPFRGAGPATAAMYGGEIQMMFDNLPPRIPDIKSGKMIGLAVTTLKRNPAVPDLPTLDEIGLKGYDVSSWFGLNAPAGTPPAIIARLNQALNRVTALPDVRESLVSRGAEVIQGTPEDYLKFVQAEVVKWGPVVKRAGAVVE